MKNKQTKTLEEKSIDVPIGYTGGGKVKMEFIKYVKLSDAQELEAHINELNDLLYKCSLAVKILKKVSKSEYAKDIDEDIKRHFKKW